MDLDILLFGDRVQQLPGLILPRPQLTNWAFMLGPLAELAPEVLHPTTHRTIGAMWRDFDQEAHPLVPVVLDLAAA